MLDALDVLRLPAFRAFDYVELNLLTFLQAAKAVGLDGGEVHEYIFTILAADKTIALGIVKPLYCSRFHDVAVFLWLRYALEIARVAESSSGRSRCEAGHTVEQGTADNRKAKRT